MNEVKWINADDNIDTIVKSLKTTGIPTVHYIEIHSADGTLIATEADLYGHGNDDWPEIQAKA